MYTRSSSYKLALKTTLFLFATTFVLNTSAKEGMWLPSTLKNRENDMKSMGLQIPIDKLYNEDGTGLNNAVVLFGKGCTGELISSKGLILTNHHCGYGTVQGLSSKENDYFATGFWAMSMQQEIPCPGLTVTFIRKMENVTGTILHNVPDLLDEHSRDSMIEEKIKALEQNYKVATKMDAVIRPFYNGNQYWMIVSETYRDVRLVGFPPNGIGSFGGDSDNWMWPRHTGDFSLFRVYADVNNKPADYSKNNKAYQPKQFFTISTKGYKEGDFTMVYGFPGTTQEYIHSSQLNQIYSISDPIRIAMRTKKLDVWTKNMQQSHDVFLKYTSKRAGVANGWKKWQGELRGLEINDVLNKKMKEERDYDKWALRDTAAPIYASLLMTRLYAASVAADSVIKADEYIKEAVLGVELIQQGGLFNKMLACFRAHLTAEQLHDTIGKLAAGWDGFYKNYDAATDQQLFSVMIPTYMKKCAQWVPSYYQNMYQQYNNNIKNWSTNIYSVSMVAQQDKFNKFVSKVSAKDSVRILADPAWQLYNAIASLRKEKITPVLNDYNQHMSYLNRLYLKTQMIKDKQKDFYPDANLTLRLTYGKVEGIDPEGPAPYSYQTNLNEAIAKDNPSVEEFKVPEKLKELYHAKNYGKWAVNGTVPIAFTASNHTSGGNSGSPVLNAKGELIGTNFDRVWEGTMSDLNYDPKLCRNISLDIRYTLFIIEKFGNAGWLLKEMRMGKDEAAAKKEETGVATDAKTTPTGALKPTSAPTKKEQAKPTK